MWYENGNKKVELNFVKGKMHGRCTWYYDTGKKREEGLFSNGKKCGVWKSWSPQGAKRLPTVHLACK